VSGHLDDDAFERLAMGELGDAERAAALRHVAACEVCSRMYMALRSLEAGARAIDPSVAATASGLDEPEASASGLDAPAVRPEQGASPRRVEGRSPSAGGDARAKRRRRNAAWLIGGGAAALAAAALLLVWPRGDGQTPDGAGSGAVRGDGVAPIEIVAPRGPGPRPATFTWRAIDRAETYRVTIHADDGRAVWQQAADAAGAAAVSLPADVALPPGAYRWRVEALRGGAVVARSPLVPFAVAP
jgi:hypothetical protein